MSFSPRPSPFKRPESPAANTPSTIRAASPAVPHPSSSHRDQVQPAGRQHPSNSPMLGDRQSPFARRPSQLTLGSDRPKSPFASRAPSRLSVAETPVQDDPFISQPKSSGSSWTSRPSPSPELITSPTLPSGPPPMTRRETSSTVATVRPLPQPSTTTTAKPSLAPFANAGSYSHVPPPLLRSMRESFEVLDTTSSNAISKADLAQILEQLGLDASSRSIAAFFPPGQQTLNLARFLDMLTEPMRDLSDKDELTAAFAAFDVDDSGQIDVRELRDAVLQTMPEAGVGARLNDADVDALLAEFAGRRAFGAKGVSGKEVGARGDVFKYKDFMANITGSGQGADGVAA